MHNILDLKIAKSLLPERPIVSNKGTFGKVLLICGSKTMVGCCCLAVTGALRSGAGIVSLAFPDCLYTGLIARLTENLFIPLPSDANGFIDGFAVNAVLNILNQYDAVLIGCGIGISDGTKALVKSLVENCTSPLILDADALNCLCDFKESLLNRKAEILLTPHPGEFSRLTGYSIKDIESCREAKVKEFCDKYKVNLLLKGHRTLICNSSADSFYENRTGNSGLSKGGAGDLLSGIISGLTPALKGDLFVSAALGAFVHGLSADILKAEFSEYSMLPSDCAFSLNKVFKLLEENN